MTNIRDFVRQPDKFTCQAAAIAKVAGGTVQEVRAALVAKAAPLGTIAGDTRVMGQYLKPRVKEYQFSDRASLTQISEWVTRGPDYEVIIHGAFTGSGHVIGIENRNNSLGYPGFQVDDPWAEFDCVNGIYLWNKSGKNVIKSARCIWAYCVVAYNPDQGHHAYHNREVDWHQGGAWTHFIRN